MGILYFGCCVLHTVHSFPAGHPEVCGASLTFRHSFTPTHSLTHSLNHPSPLMVQATLKYAELMDKAYRNNDIQAAQAEQVFAGSWMAAAAQLVLVLTSLDLQVLNLTSLADFAVHSTGQHWLCVCQLAATQYQGGFMPGLMLYTMSDHRLWCSVLLMRVPVLRRAHDSAAFCATG